MSNEQIAAEIADEIFHGLSVVREDQEWLRTQLRRAALLALNWKDAHDKDD